jgi:hypothetical protein
MPPSPPVYYDIRRVSITSNELCEKQATENINLLKGMGKTGREIAEKPIQIRKPGRTIAIELDTEKSILQKMKHTRNKQYQYMHRKSLVLVAWFPRSAGGQEMGKKNRNELGGDEALLLVRSTTTIAHFVA